MADRRRLRDESFLPHAAFASARRCAVFSTFVMTLRLATAQTHPLRFRTSFWWNTFHVLRTPTASRPWAESPSDQAMDVIAPPPDFVPEPKAIPHRRDPEGDPKAGKTRSEA